ncbi:MAG TPA: fumarylacetoacetate hydrolase family protein, partial [Gemmatimonadales bacterium]|nr:fumarylacetoacetate hydrolase family protein [Gemmatimonadales bacterium]
PIPIADAEQHVFGLCLLNDWSARDIQAWEYQPLGPFLAKNFSTTISPWVVTSDALLPWRVSMPPRPAGDPLPLDYLARAGNGIWAIDLDVSIASPAMRSRGESDRLSSVRFDRAMYWSPAQLVTHHASNGCALQAGDLLGTGTISGTTPDSLGCLLERTRRGAEPITLSDGSQRSYLQDGDEVIMTGRTAEMSERASIGFGRCGGMIEAAG